MKMWHAGILALLLAMASFAVPASDDGWVIGTWELLHDPDGAQTDWLEFLPDGDVFNIAPDGEKIAGIYIVTPEGVKAVFTYNGKDLITVFHADAGRERLKIVTSQTGEESVYGKVGTAGER